MLLKIFFFVENLFIGAGAGVRAGEKNTRSRVRSKMDRLRNTGCVMCLTVNVLRIRIMLMCIRKFPGRRN